MSHTTFFSLAVGILFYLTAATAHADSDTPPAARPGDAHVERHDAVPSVLADFEYLQRGKVHFEFGAIAYRLAREGLNLTTRIGGAATRALIGLDGNRRVELGWQLRRASVKLAFTEQSDRSGYRIEFAREF